MTTFIEELICSFRSILSTFQFSSRPFSQLTLFLYIFQLFLILKLLLEIHGEFYDRGFSRVKSTGIFSSAPRGVGRFWPALAGPMRRLRPVPDASAPVAPGLRGVEGIKTESW